MADQVTLDSSSGGGKPFPQHPIGQFIGVLVDVVDVGERKSNFPGKPVEIARKVALVFQTGVKDEEGKLFEIATEVTVSSNEKAALVKLIGQWIGRPLTQEEIKAGIQLHSFVGRPGLLSIVNKPSAKGKDYSKIDTITPLFPGLETQIPVLPPYTRDAFWQKKKEAYALEVADYRKSKAAQTPNQMVGNYAPPPVAQNAPQQPVTGFPSVAPAQAFPGVQAAAPVPTPSLGFPAALNSVVGELPSLPGADALTPPGVATNDPAVPF